MYFLGASRYSNRVSSVHTMPEFLLASVYWKPAAWPDWRPIRPCRLGPCLCAPPASTVWHWLHLVLKICARTCQSHSFLPSTTPSPSLSLSLSLSLSRARARTVPRSTPYSPPPRRALTPSPPPRPYQPACLPACHTDSQPDSQPAGRPDCLRTIQRTLAPSAADILSCRSLRFARRAAN
jgi:hypothetical protein